MRIWKRLLGTALCLCAAVCLMSVSASAAEHSHPICGDITKCTNPDHSGENHGDAVEWIKVTKANVTNGELKLTAGESYYLGENISVEYAITIEKGTVNLCLNGNTLSRTSTVIEVKGGATLNICDCQSNGEITNTSTGADNAVQVTTANSNTTLNLYSGKISSSAKYTVDLYDSNSRDDLAAVLNMYGGEVYNDKSPAMGIRKSGSGLYKINIHDGNVTSTNDYGINASYSGNANICVASGMISGYRAALNVLGNLTLSGSPMLKHTNEGGADVRITTTNVAETENDHITVSDDFTPAEGTKVSVDVPNNQLQTGRIIAKPAAGASSLSDKARDFVSAEKNYFVESNSDGDLQLTACAITKQPAVENSYTVTANGSDDKVTYQWYSAKQGDVPVTSKNASADKFRSNWNDGEWSYGDRAENGNPVSLGAFTLHMNAGDVLKLTEAREVGSFSFADSNNNPVNPDESSRMPCTYTAPADGEYTLTVTATPREYTSNGVTHYFLNASFKATVTADVLGGALAGQVKAALDTSQLATGSYICQVTWENKTTRNSQTVRYAAASSHVHSWSKEWKSDATHHWHECKNANCDVTKNSAKGGYGTHSGGAANCTQQAVCAGCGAAYGALDSNGHDWGEWAVTKPATTSAAGVETRVCKRNASHTETRAIPKLTPAPSGGGSSSGSGSGSSSTPAVTVPVSGSGDTVHVSASVSGSTAEVKEIKSAELDKIGTDSAVVIDLSGLNKGVTGVTLSTDTIDSICKAEADGVTIKLPNAELRVDRQTLAAVTEQAAGSSVRLVVEPDGTARSTMTASQRSALDGMRNAAVLEAYFVSDGMRIRDFNGGEVELSIPYQASGALRAWFLKEDGTREPVSAHYDKENAQLILHHFSHYVIEELDSSAAYTVCAKDDTCPLAAFGDLTATAWYHDGVHYCIENGLMQGVSAKSFLPNGSTTRAQLVTILWRLEGSPDATEAVSFSDTADGAWYAGAVRWAAGSGVVKGYDSKHFGPNDAVTREQMVTILYRYAQYKGYDVSIGEDTNILSFNDALTISGYSIPAMQWACGSGLMTGTRRDGGMALASRDTTTRAQTATLLTRFQSAFAKEP